MKHIHPILLGVADRVLPLAGGNPAMPMDIRGLRQVVVSWLYPLDLRNLVLLLRLPGGMPMRGKLEFATEGPGQLFWLEYRLSVEGHDDSTMDRLERPIVAGFPLRSEHSQPIVWQPGRVAVSHERDDDRSALGDIDFVYQPPPALTTDESRAIESNPTLKRVIRFVIRCSSCSSAITPYVALERPPSLAPDAALNPVWYKDLEGEFGCTCGKLKFPLKYLREGMPRLLLANNSLLPDGSFATTSQISVEDTEKILALFRRLLEKDPAEEEVQEFIEQHPLMLAPFAARQVFFKPPVLNQRRADFGVVTAMNELLLIEIERPSLPLFTKEGIQRAELTHAFWQPQTWEQEITNHRAAVLRGISGCPADISRVRYLVVAGRSGSSDDEAIARTVRASRDCDFMTYDHLVEAVRNAVRAASG